MRIATTDKDMEVRGVFLANASEKLISWYFK